MPFFSNLADRLGGYTLSLTITKSEDGKLNVMVLPKVSDKAEIQKEIVPLSIKGTPAELDQQFFATLGTTLDKTKTIAMQIKNYEKSLDNAGDKGTGTKTEKKAEKPDDKKTDNLFDKKIEEKAEEKANEKKARTPVEPISAASLEPEPEVEPETEPEAEPESVDEETGEITSTDEDDKW